MTEATAAFFHDLEARTNDPLLEKVKGTLRFELAPSRGARRALGGRAQQGRGDRLAGG